MWGPQRGGDLDPHAGRRPDRRHPERAVLTPLALEALLAGRGPFA